MSHIVDIFLQPGRVFAEQKERPTFLVPLLIVSAFAAAFTLAYFLSVDPVWYLDHAIAAGGEVCVGEIHIGQGRSVAEAGHVGHEGCLVVCSVRRRLAAGLLVGVAQGHAPGGEHVVGAGLASVDQ